MYENQSITSSAVCILVHFQQGVRFLKNLHENKTLYDIMLWNKSLIMNIFIFIFLNDVLLVKIAYLSFKIYLKK